MSDDRCSGCGVSVFDEEGCICDRILEPSAEEAMFEVPGRKLRRMHEALQATLHILSADNWNDNAKAKWFALTGTHDCTYKALCDVIRKALGDDEGEDV